MTVIYIPFDVGVFYTVLIVGFIIVFTGFVINLDCKHRFPRIATSGRAPPQHRRSDDSRRM